MAAGDIVVIRENADSHKGNYYDGTDDYVLHDNHAVERVAAADTVGTYSALVYFNDAAGTYTILSAGDNDAVEYLRLTINAGKLQVYVYQGAACQLDVIETTASMSARKWHHVAVVQNGTNPTLYVDGAAVAMTNTTSTDLTAWYDTISGGDKFAIGILEMNGTHTQDFNGAIGHVRYWFAALTAKEIAAYYKYDMGIWNSTELSDDLGSARVTALNALLRFNVTYEDDGITDTGLGDDDGTLTGHAYYGGEISDWSFKLNSYASVTGHAAEFINSFRDGVDYVSIIKKGD